MIPTIIEQLVTYLEENPYAFPGGHERFLITSDGLVFCVECVRENIAEIRHESSQGWTDRGWAGCVIENVSTVKNELLCSHCGDAIQEGDDDVLEFTDEVLLNSEY